MEPGFTLSIILHTISKTSGYWIWKFIKELTLHSKFIFHIPSTPADKIYETRVHHPHHSTYDFKDTNSGNSMKIYSTFKHTPGSWMASATPTSHHLQITWQVRPPSQHILQKSFICMRGWDFCEQSLLIPRRWTHRGAWPTMGKLFGEVGLLGRIQPVVSRSPRLHRALETGYCRCPWLVDIMTST